MLEIGSEHGWPTLPQVHSREPSLGVTEGGSPALPKEAWRAPVRGKLRKVLWCHTYASCKGGATAIGTSTPVCMRTKGRLISSGM